MPDRPVATDHRRSLTGRIARAVTDYDRPGSLGQRFRARRIARLCELVRTVHARERRVRVIDVGGTRAFWNLVPPEFLERHEVSVTIVNLPGADAGEPGGRFRVVAGDGCDLAAFADGAFDLAHSNSVIEHVGDDARMRAFAREITRVAPACFVQTPHAAFPIEPHFMTPCFHWLPRAVRAALVRRFALGQWPRQRSRAEAFAAVDSVRLLDGRRLRALFPGARIVVERLAGLPKSLLAIRDGSGGVRPS